MKIGFIGAGKVGTTLGKFFAEGGIPVTGYYSLHRDSAIKAAEFTRTQVFQSISSLVAQSDTVFLTVPDGSISEVYQTLRQCDLAGKNICHCSGSLTSGEAFPGIESTGALAYSIHPLFPISNKYTAYREIKGVFFCLEGPQPGLSIWGDLLHGLGCHVLSVQPQDKVTYHLACTIASNLVCGLIQESLNLMVQCGVDSEKALQALKPLILSNVNHVLDSGPGEALTGPVERNDIDTVKKHISSFSLPEERSMYCSVSKQLVKMAEQRHPDTDYSSLSTLLEKGMES